jgi:transposase
MPKKHPSVVRDRSVRMVLDRLENYSSLSAACRDLAPKLNVGIETLRKWVMQAQADSGATTEQLAEMAKLKRENAELRETNDILKAAASFFARELDPRHR